MGVLWLKRLDRNYKFIEQDTDPSSGVSMGTIIGDLVYVSVVHFLTETRPHLAVITGLRWYRWREGIAGHAGYNLHLWHKGMQVVFRPQGFAWD